jgi:hypothetical protein
MNHKVALDQPKTLQQTPSPRGRGADTCVDTFAQRKD